MKNILVPTDFSDCSRIAESLAIELAQKSNAEIHFLHIFDSPVDWVKLPLEKEELYPETRLKFHNANRELNDWIIPLSRQNINSLRCAALDLVKT